MTIFDRVIERLFYNTVQNQVREQMAVIENDNNYPTDDELKKINKWDCKDLHGLMAYIRELWEFADYGYWSQKGDTYYLDTAGWSGNEDIIAALQKNRIFWMFYWQQSRRGGHYIFQPIRNSIKRLQINDNIR